MTFKADVLVIPTRPAARLADLTSDEVSSLFSAVQKVGKAVETAYEADALTIALQVCHEIFDHCVSKTNIVYVRTARQLGSQFHTCMCTSFRGVSKETNLKALMTIYILPLNNRRKNFRVTCERTDRGILNVLKSTQMKTESQGRSKKWRRKHSG